MEIDLRSFTAGFNGRPLALTPKELRVLITLARDAGRTFTRRQLIDAAFGFDYDGGDRTIDTHVWSLRRKLAAMDGTTEWITTVHGYGYRFEERLT